MIFEKVELVSTENSSSQDAAFSRVSSDEYGYAPAEVDAFVARARESFANGAGTADALTAEDIRTATFEPTKGGYDAAEVDEALDRLEQAFLARGESATDDNEGPVTELAPVSAASGPSKYDAAAPATAAVTEIPSNTGQFSLSDVVRGRLDRAPGERFRAPSNPDASSYHRDDVDALCDRLRDDPHALSAQTLRDVTFRVTRGDEGYEEAQVDGFLDYVIGEIEGRR